MQLRILNLDLLVGGEHHGTAARKMLRDQQPHAIHGAGIQRVKRLVKNPQRNFFRQKKPCQRDPPLLAAR